MWQSDFTHIRLADGTDTEVISWLDDHSRYLLHITCHRSVTGPVVIESFLAAADTHGLPASTLTDNGMVYTTRLSRGSEGRNSQPNAFETLIADLGIIQKNGRPGHPTTQGKIERFHQTLKRWLAARPPAADLELLQELLTEFTTIYNTQRPHRALDRQTPHTIYTTGIKDTPRIEIAGQPWRVRYDIIGQTGTITIRYAGRLRHLGIGRAHATTRIIALAHGPDVMILAPNTGEIIAEFTINPAKNYQPKRHPTQPKNATMTRDTTEP